MITYIFLTILVICATILAYPLVPIAVFFADEATGRLPKIFRWLETHDDLGWGAGTYEHPIGEAYKKHGKRVAMIFWLWRNKAYTLRNSLRAKVDYNNMQTKQSGSDVPPKYGFWCSKYTVKSNGKNYFDTFLGCSFGKFFVYLRCGWKVKPIVQGQRPDSKSATGMFSGISIRSDDWDDFPVEQRPL